MLCLCPIQAILGDFLVGQLKQKSEGCVASTFIDGQIDGATWNGELDPINHYE